MKISGVGVNEKNLPSKENLIKQALKGKKYYQLPKAKAVKLIEKEIKDSGLFKSTRKRVKKSDGNDSKPSRLSTSRKRGLDKGKDKK